MDPVELWSIRLWWAAAIVWAFWGLAMFNHRAPESPTGPQCTLVYPRGFEFSKATPEDGRTCGDIAVSWRACTPKWAI